MDRRPCRWHQNSWHIWNITVFISFSFSSSSQSSVSRCDVFAHNDYYLFICFHIVVGCFACCAQEFSMCASITHNSNKFSPYLCCYSPSSFSSTSFHIVRLPLPSPEKLQNERQVDATFGKMKNYQRFRHFCWRYSAATTTSAVHVILIQLRSKIHWANTAKLRTDWRIIQYYSLQRKQKKTKRKPKSFPFFFGVCVSVLHSLAWFVSILCSWLIAQKREPLQPNRSSACCQRLDSTQIQHIAAATSTKFHEVNWSFVFCPKPWIGRPETRRRPTTFELNFVKFSIRRNTNGTKHKTY